MTISVSEYRIAPPNRAYGMPSPRRRCAWSHFLLIPSRAAVSASVSQRLSTLPISAGLVFFSMDQV